MTKRTEAETYALDQLRELLPVGSEVYTLVRSVSSSGMSRRISMFMVQDGKIESLDWRLVRAGIAKRRGNAEGLYIQGVGMDMCFALTYDLAITLHHDGYSITNRNL